MVAMRSDESPRPSELCAKALPEPQEALVASDAKRYFVPPSWVRKSGSACASMPGSNWSVVTDLVHEAFRMTAPKRLATRLDSN
jgi:hypothetical protein